MKLNRALLQTMRFLVDAAIWVVLYVLPVGAVVLVPVLALWLLWHRRKRPKPEGKA